MAPQLAAVVHALALVRLVQEQRDAVLGAANRERTRLRSDLHNGLGHSLTGVGLGLQALGGARRPKPDRGAAAAYRGGHRTRAQPSGRARPGMLLTVHEDEKRLPETALP